MTGAPTRQLHHICTLLVPADTPAHIIIAYYIMFLKTFNIVNQIVDFETQHLFQRHSPGIHQEAQNWLVFLKSIMLSPGSTTQNINHFIGFVWSMSEYGAKISQWCDQLTLSNKVQTSGHILAKIIDW